MFQNTPRRAIVIMGAGAGVYPPIWMAKRHFFPDC